MKVNKRKKLCCKHEFVTIHEGDAEYTKGERETHIFTGTYKRCKKCGQVKKNFKYLGGRE